MMQTPTPRSTKRRSSNFLEPRTQQARSAATRLMVNDAIIECLIEVGYSGASMSTITQAAGVSRGAITHQFGTKKQMLIAAIENLVERPEVEFRRLSRAMPTGEGRTRAVLAVLWEVFKSDLFFAMLEMWNAARTDAELRDAVRESEREQGARHRLLLGEMFGPKIAEHPDFGVALDLTFNLMRGMALTDILRDNTRREARLLDEWTDIFVRLVASGTESRHTERNTTS